MKRPMPPLEWDADTIQLHGFSRGVHQIQWLLVSLVLLYLALTGDPFGRSQVAALGTLAYFLVTLGAQALPTFGFSRRWLLAWHTWVMIAFITWLLYVLGGVDGPLVGLYVLAVITAALALGKLATMLEVMVVAACYLLLLYHGSGGAAFAGPGLAIACAHVIMFLLVGYLTTVLADAIHLANERMLLMARTDPLTGFANRNALAQATRDLVETAQRRDAHFVVLMADMDNLKLINDGFGHSVGDAALVAVAERIKGIARDGDILSRLHGDEFVVVFPDTTVAEGRAMADRLLAQIEAHSRLATAPRISIGLAGFPEHGASMDALLHRADEAMYAAKRGGGHAVQVYSREMNAAHTHAMV
ncbi:GGDEF domain-containing protein [Algiphilus sp.]|uniref:GGDEF domain-containing protein n=1 Tax=Algiphilus sp. TaxID=1872431 RepID=UPI003B515BA0